MSVYGPPGNEELYHYGIPKKSGRYPYGSGENPYQGEPGKQKARKTAGSVGVIGRAKLRHERKVREKEKIKKAEAKKKEVEKLEAEKKAAENKPASERVKTMTDEEIYTAINRLRLEQSYLQLLNSSQNESQKSSQQNQQDKVQQVGKQIQKNAQIVSGKNWVDSLISKTKKAGDLATNLNNIAKGANGTYANVMAIKKAMDAAAKLVKEEEKK